MKFVFFVFVAFFCLIIQSSAIDAKSWRETIHAVEQEAKKYWDFAQEKGAFPSPGTAVNEIGVPKHQCTISGRILGLTHLIESLEFKDAPKLLANPTEDQVLEIQIHSVWLSNWAFVARKLNEMNKDDVKKVWNLNCAGKFGIPDTAFLPTANPNASFEQDGNSLIVLGDIEVGFFERFESWLATHPETEYVYLGSGGGSVLDAIKVGNLIRRKNLKTSLFANCYSACPLVFLGGYLRIIWSPYPRLGFHQISLNGQPVHFDHPIYEIVAEYSYQMGADSKFIVWAMQSKSPDAMYEPELVLLCKTGITTAIQRVC